MQNTHWILCVASYFFRVSEVLLPIKIKIQRKEEIINALHLDWSQCKASHHPSSHVSSRTGNISRSNDQTISRVNTNLNSTTLETGDYSTFHSHVIKNLSY
ncbi:hypothetical protein ACTFIW_003640 [Dictyostelium discoideum]